jgi:sensor histidine kinase regulating citrate/malate metabolism
MDADLALTVGMVLIGFSITSLLSALSDLRSPRASAVIITLALALIVTALYTKPGGYRLGDIPNAFYGVIGRVLP